MFSLAAVARRIGQAGAALLLGFALSTSYVQAQPGKLQAPTSSQGIGKTAAPVRPVWSELTAAQQASLKPLEAHWNTLSESHKRRWLALSRDYFRLSIEQQDTLHGRMTEWADLSGRQRIQARLNFAEVKQLAPNERKAKWEAYQALSEEHKRNLADTAPVRPRSTAVPVRLVPAQKLVQVPPPPSKGEHGARIQLAPPVAQRTSLPVVPEATLETSVSNPAVPAAPVMPTLPSPAMIPAVPMVRMTEQPSSAP